MHIFFLFLGFFLLFALFLKFVSDGLFPLCLYPLLHDHYVFFHTQRKERVFMTGAKSDENWQHMKHFTHRSEK